MQNNKETLFDKFNLNTYLYTIHSLIYFSLAISLVVWVFPWLFWATAQTDINQSQDCKLYEVTRDRQLGLFLPHCLKTSHYEYLFISQEAATVLGFHIAPQMLLSSSCLPPHLPPLPTLSFHSPPCADSSSPIKSIPFFLFREIHVSTPHSLPLCLNFLGL